jgi:hypothetical protein
MPQIHAEYGWSHHGEDGRPVIPGWNDLWSMDSNDQDRIDSLSREALSLSCDLDDLFSDVASTLPRVNDPDGDSLTLSASLLPRSPETLTTNRFWMPHVGFHFYNGFPVPSVNLCIDKSSCRNLALLIFSVLFHPEPSIVEVRLNHPSSQIKRLRVRYEHPDPDHQGLAVIPAHFTYSTDDVHRQPWGTHLERARPTQSAEY